MNKLSLGHEKAIAEFKALDTVGRLMALIELMESEHIDFIYLQQLYVEKLLKEKRALISQISTLDLELGLYAMKDKSEDGRRVREKLWKAKTWAGSKFGEQLENEFNQQK